MYGFWSCLKDFWSTTTEQPLRDPSQDFKLIKASENCGTVTEVEFTRNAITEDNVRDVQFKVRFKQVKPVINK